MQAYKHSCTPTSMAMLIRIHKNMCVAHMHAHTCLVTTYKRVNLRFWANVCERAANVGFMLRYLISGCQNAHVACIHMPSFVWRIASAGSGHTGQF